MKMITRVGLLVSTLICLNVNAQRTANLNGSGVLREDNIIDTRRELRREHRVRKGALNSDKIAERFAKRQLKNIKRPVHRTKRKRVNYERVEVNKRRR